MFQLERGYLFDGIYHAGAVDESEKLVRTTLKDAQVKGLSTIPRIGLLWTLLGEILREKGMLEEAERCVERGLLFSEPEKPCLGWNYIFRIALSFSQRDYDQAFEFINEAEILNQEFHLPFFVTAAIERWKVRLLVEKEKADEALKILSSTGINKDSTVQGGHEWRYLLLVRILLKQKTPDQEAAGRILEEVENLSKQGGYTKLLLESMIVKALYAELSGSPGQAEMILASALSKGENLGFFQIFCDSGKDIESILKRIIKNNQNLSDQEYGNLKSYINSIITSSGLEIGSRDALRDKTILEPKPEEKFSSELIEDLTSRELEVLGLIKEGLSNEAIAKQLFLSLGTVKWHTTNIYGKLGVRRRTEAVAQASKLKLIS